MVPGPPPSAPPFATAVGIPVVTTRYLRVAERDCLKSSRDEVSTASSLPRSGENIALLPHLVGLWKPTLVPDERFQMV
jgi:hypothetical protein